MKIPFFRSEAGIYILICLANQRFYIGSSVKLKRRAGCHRRELDAGVHENQHLQRAWIKYGRDAFMFGVLEYCPKADVIVREQVYLDRFHPYLDHIGFNIQRIAGAQKNISPLPQTVAKHRATKAQTRNERVEQQLALKGVSFEIVSPEGVLHQARGIQRFARDHGLDATALCAVLKGRSRHLSVRGWHLPQSSMTR